MGTQQKVVVVGAGPVGALAALYAAVRGDEVEVYELRGGISPLFISTCPSICS
jgi:thioredoxin reductase